MCREEHPTPVGWTIPALWGILVWSGQGVKLLNLASRRSAREEENCR